MKISFLNLSICVVVNIVGSFHLVMRSIYAASLRALDKPDAM
jgi:hypothetical protein